MLESISAQRATRFYGKKWIRWVTISCALLCICASSAFCANSAGDLPEETGLAPSGAAVSPAGPPASGGSIFFGTIGEASNLIPYLTSDSASHEVADLIYTAPLRYNKDLQPEPWAAESWSMEDGGKRMRFTLRKGILWEDGQS